MKFGTNLIILKLILCFASVRNGEGKKNIILILLDDLDLTLDGMVPLINTRNLIGNQGATFLNCFVASPICCPNRASILTGRYQHNHGTVNNSISGGCGSRRWQRKLENTTFSSILKYQYHYNTFYAGKYLNQYGLKKAGGAAHIPPGWDWWIGLIGNSKYYNYSLSINGTEKKYGDSSEEYLTDVIANRAVDFINGPRNYKFPFLMVLSPPAPHEPFTPALRHVDKYKDKKAKRTPNFNIIPQEDKHWFVKMGYAPLPNNTLSKLDYIHRRRWETLLSVDELVARVYEALVSRNILNNTYIIFTSDNGYHIGQFSMPKDKRQPYETDIRIPLMIRGPRIEPSSFVKAPVNSVDLFNTILHMAGVKKKNISDGTSVLKKNISTTRTVLIEYKGESTTMAFGCPTDFDKNVSHCNKEFNCKCEDAKNNTYSCIRTLSEIENYIFCVFEDSQDYIEAYDLINDPYQLYNIGYKMGPNQTEALKNFLKKMVKCKNDKCINRL